MSETTHRHAPDPAGLIYAEVEVPPAPPADWAARLADAERRAEKAEAAVAEWERLSANAHWGLACGVMDDEYAACHRAANHKGPCCHTDSITRSESPRGNEEVI